MIRGDFIWEIKSTHLSAKICICYLFPLVQLWRYFTGKCADLIWHSLLKEKSHNIFGTHPFWRKENNYMTGWTSGGDVSECLHRSPLLSELWSIDWDVLKVVNKWAKAWAFFWYACMEQPDKRKSVFIVRSASVNLALRWGSPLSA